jgi:hypothetical protein
LADIQANTPWELHGAEGDPGFLDYDPNEHNLQDESWPEFHILSTSVNVIDRGTTKLPASLAALLGRMGVDDVRLGSAFDIGRYEAAGVLCTPAVSIMQPGTVTDFALSLYPVDFPGSLVLSVSSTPADLTLSLSSTLLNTGETIILTVVDNHDPQVDLVPALQYKVIITAGYAEGTQNTEIRLLIGSLGWYLPIILKTAYYETSVRGTREELWEGVQAQRFSHQEVAEAKGRD